MLFERFVRPEVKERFAFDILERQVEANKIDGEKGLMSANTSLSYYTLNQFLAKLSGGKFLEKLPHQMSNYAGYNLYSPDDAEPCHLKTTRYAGVDLSEKDTFPDP